MSTRGSLARATRARRSSRSRRATRRSKIYFSARSPPPTNRAKPRRVAYDRADLGDRAQHVPRSRAHPRALRDHRARHRRQSVRDRARPDVDPRRGAGRTRRRARGDLAVRFAHGDLPRRVSSLPRGPTPHDPRHCLQADRAVGVRRRQVRGHGARAQRARRAVRARDARHARVAARRRFGRGRARGRARVDRGAHRRGDRDLLFVIFDAVPVWNLRAGDVGDRPADSGYRSGDPSRGVVDPRHVARRARDRARSPSVLALRSRDRRRDRERQRRLRVVGLRRARERARPRLDHRLARARMPVVPAPRLFVTPRSRGPLTIRYEHRTNLLVRTSAEPVRTNNVRTTNSSKSYVRTMYVPISADEPAIVARRRRRRLYIAWAPWLPSRGGLRWPRI